MYRTLRWIRITVSAVYLILLTLAILDAAFEATFIGRWIMEAQLGKAILAGWSAWVVVWVVLTITFGRVYCSSVCPLGTLQDAVAHCARRVSRGEAKRYKYAIPINELRFPIPIIVALCLFAGLTIVVTLTDPYSIYGKMALSVARPAAIGLGSAIGAWCTMLIIGIIAWRRGRLFCNTVCPIGGLLGLLSRNPIYRVDINTDLCIHCGKCEDVCKSQCINLTDCTVDNSRCVMCMDCTAVCPNKAITVRKGRFRLSTPMMIQTSNNAAGYTSPDLSSQRQNTKTSSNS